MSAKSFSRGLGRRESGEEEESDACKYVLQTHLMDQLVETIDTPRDEERHKTHRTTTESVMDPQIFMFNLCRSFYKYHQLVINFFRRLFCPIKSLIFVSLEVYEHHRVSIPQHQRRTSIGERARNILMEILDILSLFNGRRNLVLNQQPPS